MPLFGKRKKKKDDPVIPPIISSIEVTPPVADKKKTSLVGIAGAVLALISAVWAIVKYFTSKKQ
jgi:hypothetical protein